jgi:hypothetical protein
MYIKTGPTTWKNTAAAYIKTGPTIWERIKQGYIKTGPTLWKRFFNEANLPVEITGPTIRSANTSGTGGLYDGSVATSPQFLNADLFGKDGSYSNYTSITARRFSYADSLDATVRSTLVFDDRFSSAGGVTTANRTELDGKYLFYEVQVNNGTGDDFINPVSSPKKLIKSYPALTDMGWTGVEQVGTQLTLNYTIENYYYNKIDPGLSYVRWWRSSTTNAGGTLLKEETITATSTGATSTSRTGTSLYTPVADDINYYIVAEITGRSSYTDHYGYTDNYSMGSFPTGGVIGTALSIIDVNFTDSNGRSGKNARGNLVTSTSTTLNWKVTGVNSSTTYRVRYRVKSNETGLYYNPFSATQAAASLAWEVYEDNYNGTGNISSVSISGSTATLYDVFTIDSTFNGSTYGGGISRWILEYELSVVPATGIRRYWVYPQSMSSSQAHDYWSIDPTTDPSISRTPATISPGGTVTFSGTFNPYPAGLSSYPHSYRIVYGTSPATDSGWITLSSGTANQTYSNTKVYSDAGTYYPYIETTPSYTTNSATVTVASLYTITFDSKGGTSVSALTQSTVGGSIAQPTNPTKTSNTFGGWSTTDGGTTAVTWPRIPSANETLYAIWTEVPTTPTSLSSAITSGKIVLTFAGGTGSQYDIFYANSNSRPTDQQAFADFPNVTSPYTVDTLTSRGVTRWFWVRKSTGTVRSNWFPAAGTVVTGRISLLTPPTPVITNSAQGSTSLSWHWTEPTPSSTTEDSPSSWDYKLTSDTADPTSGWTNITTRPTSTSPLVITGLSISTSYYLHVRAKNADATGSWTNKIGTTTAAPFVTPVWDGTMPGWTAANNFQRTNTPVASRSLKYGWNNGTFSFSGSVGTSKGWDFYVSGTEPASTTTVRTPTHTRAYNTTAITGDPVQGNNYMYRVDPTWNVNSRYGSIRPYQFGTDGNKYVRGTQPNGTWSASI